MSRNGVQPTMVGNLEGAPGLQQNVQTEDDWLLEREGASHRTPRCQELLVGLCQLQAVLVKSFMVRRRRWVLSIMQMSLPLCVFGLLWWLLTWFDEKVELPRFFAGVPLFPLANLLRYDSSQSHGLLEVGQSANLWLDNQSRPSNSCVWEALWYALDWAMLCETQLIVQSLETAQSFGRGVSNITWEAVDQPNQSIRWITETLEKVETLLWNASNLEEMRQQYLNSSLPILVERVAHEVDQEVQNLMRWHQAGYKEDANYKSSYLFWLSILAFEDDRTLGEALAKGSTWLRANFGFSFSNHLTWMTRQFTTGWLSGFLLPRLRKSFVSKRMAPLWSFLEEALGISRGISFAIKSLAEWTEMPSTLAKLAWAASYFAKSNGALADLKANDYLSYGAGMDSGIFAKSNEYFGMLLNDWGDSVVDTRTKNESRVKTREESNFLQVLEDDLQRISLRLHGVASELLKLLNVSHSEPDNTFMNGKWRRHTEHILEKFVTEDMFKAIDAIESNKFRDTSEMDPGVWRWLTWLRRGWLRRCTFRRDWLTNETNQFLLMKLFSDTKFKCPIWKLISGRNDTLNITSVVHAANAFVANLDLAFLSKASKDLAEVLAKSQLKKAIPEALYGMLTAAQTNLTANTRLDIAAVVDSVQEEYRRLRNISNQSFCSTKPNRRNLLAAVLRQLPTRRILVAPYAGEVKRLVTMLVVELTHSVSQWKEDSALDTVIANLLRCPIARAATSQALTDFLDRYIVGLRDQTSLEQFAAKNPDKVLFGLVFQSADPDTGNFPTGPLQVEYSLRAHPMLLPSTNSVLITTSGTRGTKCFLDHYVYYSRGFSILQELLGRAVARLEAFRGAQGKPSIWPPTYQDVLANLKASESIAPAHELHLRAELAPRMAPKAPMAWEKHVLRDAFPFFTVISMIPTVTMTVDEAVQDKEDCLKDVLRIMGLKSWAASIGSMICPLFQMAFLVFCIVTLTFVGPGRIFDHSSVFVVYFTFLCYSFSTVSASSLLAAFFDRSKVAAAVGAYASISSLFPFLLLMAIEGDPHSFITLPLSLASASGMAWGVVTVFEFEAQGSGAQWHNFFQSPPVGSRNGPSLAGYCCMMILSAVVYQVLAWYIEKVAPGSYGLARPWYFPFLRSHGLDSTLPMPWKDKRHQDDSFLLVAQNITKRHKDQEHAAVKDLSFEVKRGSILGLLGHNGAGKSTTISMAIGLYPPTSGTILMKGSPISSDGSALRRCLGFCPQHEILHSELTVEEHLRLFAAVKGISYAAQAQEVSSMLALMNLVSDRAKRVDWLSQGMRRRLSIGCALVGRSQVLVLDEPAAGLDITAKREILQILLASKPQRGILLSTHFMDEAETLCDRVIFMREGQEIKSGSCNVLKHLHGGFYTLHVQNTNQDISAEGGLSLAAVQQCITSAVVQQTLDKKNCLKLPIEERQHFPRLLALCQDYDIKYRLHAESLESVFDAITRGSTCSDEPVRDDRTFEIKVGQASLYQGRQLAWQQCRAIIRRRYVLATRDVSSWVGQLVLGFTFALMAVALVSIAGEYMGQAPPLRLDVCMYNQSWAEQGDSDSLRIPCSSDAGRAANLCSKLERLTACGASVQTLHLREQNSTMGQLIFSNMPNFGRDSLGAVSLAGMPDQQEVTLWLGDRPAHGLPVLVELFNNLRFEILGFESTHIQAWSHPLEGIVPVEAGKDIFFTWTMALFLCQLASVFILNPVHQIKTEGKLQHMVTGVSPRVYWGSEFLWDISVYLTPVVVLLLVMQVCQLDAYSGKNLLVVFILFVVHGLATIPQMYCWSSLFSSPSAATVTMIFINILLCTLRLLYTLCLDFLKLLGNDTGAVHVFLKALLNYALAPVSVSYHVGRGLYQMAVNNYYNVAIRELGLCSYGFMCDISGFDWSVAGIDIFSMGLVAICWIACKTIMEYPSLMPPWNTRFSSRGHCERLHEGSLVLTGLGKVFQVRFGYRHPKSHDVHAVKQVNLHVEQGECFCIIGPNGAGKSTTLGLIAGDIEPTHGDAYVAGYSVCHEKCMVRRQLGFCRQRDSAISARLSMKETLEHYAKLRGVPCAEIPALIHELSIQLQFQPHLSTWACQLSGGNRRKLSMAVALIGLPPVLLLDEPTTGIDATARKGLWQAIRSLTERGHAVLMASHSLEECGALCDRYAVMDAGKLKIGSDPGSFWSHHCGLYTLSVWLQGDKTEEQEDKLHEVQAFVQRILPAAELSLEQTAGAICWDFAPGNAEASLARVFQTLEEALAVNGTLHEIVSDFEVSQVSLERSSDDLFKVSSVWD